MELLPLIQETLIKILNKESAFSIALKNAYKYKNIARNERDVVAKVIGCTLRHKLVFDFRINESFPNLNENQTTSLMIYLADKLFTKTFDDLKLKVFVKQYFDLDQEIDDFVNRFANGEELIPSSIIKNDPNQYLSLRYNTPTWVVKMWKKQLGYKDMSNLLKSNYKSSYSTCKVNILKTSRDVIIENNHDFKPMDIPDMVIYDGKTPLKKHDYFKDDLLIPYIPALKEMVDKSDFDCSRGAALFCEYQTNILLDLMMRCFELRMDVICGNSGTYFDVKNQIQRFNLNNVSLYEEKSTSVLTVISKKVHTFFVLPDNSKFSNLRNSPDYFLYLDPSKMDQYIKNQRICLEECANEVEDGGELIYGVNTINKKECHNIIEDFLNAHSEYSMEYERQFLPFDGNESTFYYAILKRRENI